jgi:hypothetical protein
MSNYITITATSIQNAAGTPLASGTLSFQATDQTGAPIAFRAGGNGQVITSPAITPISAGAIGSFQVANPATAAPSGFYYRIVITDSTGQPVAKYTGVVVSGTTWSLDSYIPTTTTVPPAGGTVNGPISFSGEVQVQPPVNPTDAATKSYVDTGLAGKQASLGFTPLNAASNLGDVASTSTARTNLGVTYANLPDKPTIPAAQVNSDWNAVSGAAEILNKPIFSTYAPLASPTFIGTLAAPTINATTTFQLAGNVVGKITAGTVDLITQAGDVGTTTLYAVPVSGAGLYRVSAYIIVTQAASTSSTLPSVVLTFFDLANLTQQTYTLVPASPTGNSLTTLAAGDFVVAAEALTNITYATSGYASSGGTPMQFALHLRLEAM